MELIRIIICIGLLIISLINTISSKVLVIGANGRLGSTIVSKLLQNQIVPNCLVRNMSTASLNYNINGAHLFEGNTNDLKSLMAAMRDCKTVIDCHGVSPPRFTKFSDLFIDPSKLKNHPVSFFYIFLVNLK